MKKSVDWKVLISCFAIVYAVAFIGSLFTSPGVKSLWYIAHKSPITPPNQVFPIVWSILFFLIALSMYFSWINSKTDKIRLKIFFAFLINFFLNILWSFFYFKLRNPTLAFIDLILLLVSIIFLIKMNFKINKTSAYLLIPYLIWVIFAGVLNWGSI